ncbi:MAG: YgfZ/GcvT domain-containing protein, partial [Moraxellaceae bacterium]
FVPQMLNYESVGGVNFKKGCYPGQEVVARLYFRGKLKQRLYRLTAKCPPPAAGSAVLDASGKEVGEVVNAALAPDQRTELLAIVRNDAVAAGGLQLAPGQALLALDLPYALDASKEE